MRRLTVFNTTTIDGYFTDANGDMSWAHQSAPDPEFDAFVAGNAKGGGTLLLGRVTYDLMASYWPTPAAARDNAVVAEGMNAMQKIVVSRTLSQPSWQNTTVLAGDLVAEVRALKQASGDDIAILGSGSIVAQLMPSGLVDEVQLVVAPLVLGAGRTLFGGLGTPLPMTLLSTRRFANGKVVMSYAPAR